MEYTFLNKKTKKIETHEMKISEYDEFVKKHPNLQRYHDVAPRVAGSRGGEHLDAKTDNGWKEVLAKIGEQNPRSNLGDKYRKNKTIKEQKTNQIIEKHVKKSQESLVKRV
jgi:hypothetical protein